MKYPVTLTRDNNDTILVTFPDFPGATFGATEEEALQHAVDALLTIFDGLMKDGEDIPPPSTIDGPSVTVPPEYVARIAAYLSARTDEGS